MSNLAEALSAIIRTARQDAVAAVAEGGGRAAALQGSVAGHHTPLQSDAYDDEGQQKSFFRFGSTSGGFGSPLA